MSCSASSSFEGWNQAGAQAYYACKYLEAVTSSNLVRNIIAGVQAATQIYFADKQYETAKQAQTRLDNISTIELQRSGILFGQFQKQIPQEDAQLADAANITIPEPLWNDIRLRVTASVIRQFTEAKRKVLQCYPVSCMEARCDALAKLETEQAKAIASEVEQAYQKERALWELRKNTAKAHLLEVLKFGRGALGPSSVLLEGARAAVAQASNINPYSGWIQAINGIAQTAQGISMQEALSYRGMGANVGGALSLGNTGNNTGTDFTNGITNRIYDPDMQNYGQNTFNMTDDTVRNVGTGFVGGETNNSSIATQIANPMDNIG